MGIPGLLGLLKSIVTKRHLKDYKDQTIAVDVYTWLHPAIFTCAEDLANNKETTKHIDFCVKRVDQILAFGIKKIVLIFDGRQLPSKKGTEEKREKSREENRIEANRLMEEGKRDLATKKFASSIDVTPQMAYEFIQAIKGRPNVECIVAPYEADAQLAYLSKIGYVDVVFSEDSDLIAFGCKKVLFKGEPKDIGDEICLDNIKNCKDINMSLWDHNMFLTACILTGCDYLPSIKKMGISTAFKLVGEHRSYKKCLLSVQSKFEIPSDYDEKFQLAFLTFRFQQVYCPLKDKIVNLNSYNLEALKLQYVEKDFHNQLTQINWRDFEENVLITPLIFKILSQNFSWWFLGDMDEGTALKVSKYLIDPESLEPYKEVKQKYLGLEGSSSMQVRMGNGGLSSLQNRKKTELKGRQQSSVSDSILSKQNQISSYLKIGAQKNAISKASSYDDRQRGDKSAFLMEDANSNSMNYNRSKSNDKSQDNTDNISLSQQAIDMFSKNIFNKNSTLVKPFKPPSVSNSQNTQPNNSQISKKKSDLKRSFNDDYFGSSDEESDHREQYQRNAKIVESQLEDAASSRKDNTFDGTNYFQPQMEDKKQFMEIENKSIDEEEADYEVESYKKNLQSLNSFKSNSLIQKNVENNLQKQQSGGLSGLSKQENQNLLKKFNKNLVIDQTPSNEIKIKYPKSLLKQNLDIQKIEKVESNFYNEEEFTSNNQQEKGCYEQSQGFIKRVMFDQVYNSQDDEKSCISTQSQKNLQSIEDNGGTQFEKSQSQKLTQKTSSNENSYSKQQQQQEEVLPSLGSSAVASTVASDEKNNSRLANFTKEVNGNLVIDSQYLIKQHPEYNFLEKFSMFFKNEINI